MANTKITDLTALTGANTAQTDVFPIVDVSADETKKILVSELLTALGVTSSAAELNILDGATLTVTELNYVDGVTSSIQTQLDAKLSTATAASTYQPLSTNLTTLASLTATTDNFIVSVASAWASRTPAQVKTTLSLNNVENTAISTWAGSTNITTLGTIATGTWNATTISVAKGGTGLTALGSGLQVLRTNAGATAMEWATISAGGGDLLASNNLSDLVSASTARTNLGLGNVDNTSDASKPVSTATQTALNLKANLISPSFTTPTLGVSTATSINKVAITAPATSATLTIADGATLTASATASVSGTNTGDQTITLQGDVTGTGTGTFTTTIASGAVDIAMLSATGTPSATTFLRGDNTWATPSGGGGGSTFADNAFQVYDSVDNTKILAFEAGSITTATTRTLTIPDASGTITLNDSTATLTNKTLTAPKFASNGFIADANGNEILEFETTASAVNHLKIVNDITNGDPYIEVVGDDANVGMYMVMKGSGFFALDSSTQTTGSSRGAYACDLQIFRSSASHVASGNYAFAANYQNTASGNFASVFGNSSTASSQGAFVIGQSNTGAGQDSFTGGFRARSAMRAQFSWSGGMHSTGGNTGDNQFTMLVARRYITGVTSGQTGITLYINDGTSGEIIPDVTSLTYRTWTLKVRWNVVISAISGTADGLTASDTVGAEDTIIIKKTGSTVTVIESSLGTVYGSTNMKTGIAMGYTASGTNFRINLVAPTYTNSGTLTLKANAVLMITENGY